MEKIVVAGPFNDEMKTCLKEELPTGFELKFISSRDEYAEFGDADYIILRTLSIQKEDIPHIKKAKIIQRWGVGVDAVDLETLGARGIPVAIPSGVNAVSVSEMTLALALAVLRNIPILHNSILAGKHEKELYSKRSYTINGKTIGIIGIGNIGKKVARLFHAFGVKDILYYDPFRLKPDQEKELNVIYKSLDELFRQSDIVSLHAPLTDETRNIINEESLSKMKVKAVLINTAREELVDLNALAKVIKGGKLLGAGIDAIEKETVKKNPLAEFDNVIFTPHLGGNTVDNYAHAAKHCIKNIIKISRGESLDAADLINAQYLIK
ncbi:hypothetical protein LQZ19_04120 [Treponema primitia]|uniref:NAD(P)-dependent oxidoreductase n=1 Tax=Treponema primitia TaxID=88058 RepID=UPI003980F68A